MGIQDISNNWRLAKAGIGMSVACLLAACTSTGDNSGRGLSDSSAQNAVERVLTPNPSGEVLGAGNVRIALLVPSTIPGGAASAALEIRNGAAMAIDDFGRNQIQVVVKDTKGQAAEAQTRAGEAVSEGASLVLGPLFAANVNAAAGVTLPANLPILAFSTDTTVARRNVYLFSYTPQSDTRRIIDYASSLGKRSLLAILPKNAEGGLRGRILRQLAGTSGISVSILEYDRTPEGIQAIIATAGDAVARADSIYIPEGGPIPALVVGGLKQGGANLAGKQILGSGAWETVKPNDPNLQGAIYPGRDTSKFSAFENRYQGKFGAKPGVQAALSYDAVTLISELVRIHGPQKAFDQRNLESNRGFQGVTGAFRVLSNGTTQRALAIYQIRNSRPTLVEPAVSSFSGRGTQRS